MENGRLLRLMVFGAAVTMVVAAGVYLINLIAFPALNPGTSFTEGLNGLIGVLAFAAFLLVPAGLIYLVVAALIMGLWRRYVWWTGLLAALVPAGLIAAVAVLLDSTTTYVGPSEVVETSAAIRGVVIVASLVWSAVAGALLAELLSPSRVHRHKRKVVGA